MEKTILELQEMALERKIAKFGDLGKQKKSKRLLGLLAALEDIRALRPAPKRRKKKKLVNTRKK